MPLSKDTVIVLDRDGVINKDSADYIKSPEEWHAIPGSLEAIAKLHQAGIRLVIATNQSGLARGLFTIDTLWDIHRKMLAEVAAAGGYIIRIFFCLHGPDEGCVCRKPQPGLLHQAAEHLACGCDNMIMIGDSTRDLEAALAAGAKPLLVRTGNGRLTEVAIADDPRFQDIAIFDDLARAANALLEEMGG